MFVCHVEHAFVSSGHVTAQRTFRDGLATVLPKCHYTQFYGAFDANDTTRAIYITV